MIDSITVEVIRHSMLSAANEMARNLCRTAYNTIVYEIHDYGISFHDRDGNCIAEAPELPYFLGQMIMACKRALSSSAEIT
jgi:N-methylhydantoinase B